MAPALARADRATDMARAGTAVPEPPQSRRDLTADRLTIVALRHGPSDLTFCCACSKGLPWRGHFVGRSIRAMKVGRSTTHSANTGVGARRRERWRRKRGRHARMGSIGRYIFRTTFGAFLVVCASVTALMWITQALRDIDLMTNQGQSILVFVGITSLIIPLLADDHRADRADDRGRPCAQQARQRFRADRDERRRHAAVAAVPSVPAGRHRASRCWSPAISVYLSPDGPARAAALGDGSSRRPRHQHRAARPLHHDRSASSRCTSASGSRTASCSASSSTTSATPRSAPPSSPSRARSSRTSAACSSCSRTAACSGTRPASAIPPIVLFDSYAFDLSRLSPGRRTIKYSRARTLSVGAAVTRIPTIPLFTRPAGPVPRRVSRPHHRAALPARLRVRDLRLSRRAAHDAAKPHHVAARRHRRRRGAARHRLRRHDLPACTRRSRWCCPISR